MSEVVGFKPVNIHEAIRKFKVAVVDTYDDESMDIGVQQRPEFSPRSIIDLRDGLRFVVFRSSNDRKTINVYAHLFANLYLYNNFVNMRIELGDNNAFNEIIRSIIDSLYNISDGVDFSFVNIADNGAIIFRGDYNGS